MRDTPFALILGGVLCSVAVACAAPVATTPLPAAEGTSTSSTPTSGSRPDPSKPDPTAGGRTTDGQATNGGSGAGSSGSAGNAGGSGNGGSGTGSGSGGSGAGSGSGGSGAGSGSSGPAGSGGSGGGSQAPGAGSGSGNPGTGGAQTRPAPLTIPEFNVIFGASWTTKERDVRDGIARACGSHGADCATVAVLVEAAPYDAGDQDCAIWDLRYPKPFYPGDTYTVVIDDECGGEPPTVPSPLTIPDFNDVERASWTDAQAGVYAAVASICGDLGPECVTVRTSVEPDPAWTGTEDPDCAIRTYSTPDPLFPGDEIVIVLNDACGPG
jgi:hypothetical protein